tara:strand:- start:3322 stop:3729 length:408 start_codon:yes stop_codon:yes gene_type:complete
MKKYFAHINQSNTVLNIITVDGQSIEDGGEPTFKIPEGHRWVQTSQDNTSDFRKQAAGKGGKYDSNLDIFIQSQPYDSWALDSNNDWQAPIAYPSVTEGYVIDWDEQNQHWRGFKGAEELSTWDSDTSSWSDPAP